MLRHQIGEDAFYRAVKHYLEVNRGKNVVNRRPRKAVEEAMHINVDQFSANGCTARALRNSTWATPTTPKSTK